MRILNVREGFACNSSSTHSIIFTPTPYRDHDANADYGWGDFTIASAEAKREWMAITVRDNLRDTDPATAELICREITGLSIPTEGHIDHQSHVALPRAWNGQGIDIAFAKDLMTWVLQPNAAIWGGNDNDASGAYLPDGEAHQLQYALRPGYGVASVVARKDASGYWTIFSRDNGLKVRVAFDGSKLGVIAKRASAPELVDLKITDYCTYGCATCYQGSTPSGKHAKYYDVESVLDDLAEARVFEVAIGGGEPTLHPEFAGILEHAHKVGVIPNFTTRDPKWFLRHPGVLQHIGAVAVSCSTREDVDAVFEEIDKMPGEVRDLLKEKTTVQHILGSLDERDTADLLNTCAACEARVVLLGYKSTHRGATATPHTPKKGTWGSFLAEYMARDENRNRRLRIGVDTVLAAEVKGLVPDWRITELEGQFSCYVDGVAGTVAASSFGTHQTVQVYPVKYGDDPQAFMHAWRSLSSYSPESAYRYAVKLT